MSKRTALLGLLIGLAGAVAFGQPSVIAPSSNGDIGLITMTTADAPRAGQLTLGFYGWYAPRYAAELFDGQANNTRWFVQYGGTGSVGFGLTNWWSVFASFGGQVTRTGNGKTYMPNRISQKGRIAKHLLLGQGGVLPDRWRESSA